MRHVGAEARDQLAVLEALEDRQRDVGTARELLERHAALAAVALDVGADRRRQRASLGSVRTEQRVGALVARDLVEGVVEGGKFRGHPELLSLFSIRNFSVRSTCTTTPSWTTAVTVP